MKKNDFLKSFLFFCMLIGSVPFLHASNIYRPPGKKEWTGCLSAPNGQYPSTTFNAACLGTPLTITTASWAGNYQKVQLTGGVTYTFASSNTNDYLTVGNESGESVLSYGIGTVTYTASSSQIVRIYTHKNADCEAENVARTITVKCGDPIVISEPNFPCFFGDGLKANNLKGYLPVSSSMAFIQSADDFVVGENGLTVKEVRLNLMSNTAIATLTINFRSNNEGKPGNVIHTITPSQFSQRVIYQNEYGQRVYEVTIAIDNSIQFEQGKYWLQPVAANTDNTTVNWETTDLGSTGTPAQQSYDTGNSWNENWSGYNAVFFVSGQCGDTPPSGCLNAPYGQWPAEVTYTPKCDGVLNLLTGANYHGDYNVVELTEGVEYYFKTEVSTNLITIGNADGTQVLAAGLGELTWKSTVSGKVRYYTHADANCTTSNTSLIKRYIKCGTTAPPPANDECVNAQRIACGETVQGSTTYASNSTGYSSADVFYSFNGNGVRQNVHLLICDPNFNSVIRVYKDCSFTEQLAIGSSSLTCSDYHSAELTFTSDGVSNYIIMVEGLANAAGEFNMTVSCSDIATPETCKDLSSQRYGEEAYSFGTNINQRLAIDLPVRNESYTIYGIKPSIVGDASNFTIKLYEDSYSVPGEQIAEITNTINKKEFLTWDFGGNIYSYFIKFDTPITLEANKIYWIEVATDNGMWTASINSNTVVGSYGAFRNIYTNTWNTLPSYELNYDIFCDESEFLSVSDVVKSGVKAYPNPVKEELNISSSKAISQVIVYNTAGQIVLSDIKVQNGKINTHDLTKGNYVVKVNFKDHTSEVFKIIKE